jgi:CheY-like chemotaxis protein
MAKVLLVEDDNNLREIYEARLQAEGYAIVSAQDGEEALVVAKKEKPDLIISDVMMPKISGFEMLDILRNTDGLKDVKIIMLTALGQAEDKTRADKLGANKYLVKSQVTLEDIVTTAHQLLDDTPVTTPTTATAPDPMPSAAPAPITVATPPTEPAATPAPVPAATTPTSNPAPATTAPVTPIAEPVVQPAPTAVVPNPGTTGANTAQTSAQEEATMKNQIESFVNANQPATAATPTPSSATTTATDKMMADAVDNLVASTQPEPTTPSDVTAVEVSPTTPAAAPAPATTPAANTAATPQNDSVAIAHKKVIRPLDSAPKPDLNALLAAEDAKAGMPTADAIIAGDVTSGTPTPPPSATAEPSPSATQPQNVISPNQPQQSDGFDPNNIAL